MRQRRWVLFGAGSAVTVAAVVGLTGYFAVVGLDKADKLGSVVGALVAVAGMALTAYGVVARPDDGPRRVSQTARASEHGRVVQVGGDRLGGAASRRPAGGEVNQRAQARDGGEITQVGGDQHLPEQP